MSETEINTSEVVEDTAPPAKTTTTSTDEPQKPADDIQLEPTQEEMERERLAARAEQLQDDILRLREEIQSKEDELAAIKKELGITAYVEFKQSMAHGWKVMGDKWKEMQETETYRKIDEKLTGWKTKVEENETYQKTVTKLNEGGKKASDALSAAGTRIKESETMQKTSSALKRTGTKIKETGSAIKDSETVKNVGAKIRTASTSLKERVWASTDQADGTIPEGNTPTKGETVVPDEPPKE